MRTLQRRLDVLLSKHGAELLEQMEGSDNGGGNGGGTAAMPIDLVEATVSAAAAIVSSAPDAASAPRSRQVLLIARDIVRVHARSPKVDVLAGNAIGRLSAEAEGKARLVCTSADQPLCNELGIEPLDMAKPVTVGTRLG